MSNEPPEIITLAAYGHQQYVRADLVSHLCAELHLLYADGPWPNAITEATAHIVEALRAPENQPRTEPYRQPPVLKGGGVEAEKAHEKC